MEKTQNPGHFRHPSRIEAYTKSKTMKLRLRSLESKETIKIEVPDSCSLHQLKDIISHTISSSSSSLHLSLNRKDEIHASSPDEPLHSLGVAAGDLVFYSLNPTAFSLDTPPHKPEASSRDGPTEKPPTLDAAQAETVDVTDRSDEVMAVSSNSEPFFTRRVLKDALGNSVSDFKLLVFAVHGIILESGFVQVDLDSGMVVGYSQPLDDSPSRFSSVVSLSYTLPEILANGAFHSVTLKFQNLGHFVNVCGSLSGGDVGSRLHCVCLDERKCARPIEVMLANYESKDSVNSGGDFQFENEVFEMWKMAKDRLALPLLIDLCEKSGLDLPPCFMRLPMELKLMILERLHGVDLAKVACTCSELLYLSTINELWKKKYEEEFGEVGESRGRTFKDLFAWAWKTKKSWKGISYRGFSRPTMPPPNRFLVPPFWGGRYGVQPVLFPGRPSRRFVIPPCLMREFNHSPSDV